MRKKKYTPLAIFRGNTVYLPYVKEDLAVLTSLNFQIFSLGNLKKIVLCKKSNQEV